MITDLFRIVNEYTGSAPGTVTYINRTITLGGVDRNGDDATNDLTYLFLDVMSELAFATAPAVYMRVSKKSPDRLLRHALDILTKGIGYPSLFNDEVFIPGLQAVGVSLEDAREYAPTGCGEMNIPGRNMCNCTFAQLNTLMIFTLALNNGRDPSTGEQLGPMTGEIESFGSIEQVINAYKGQFAYFVALAKERGDVIMEDLQLNGYMSYYSTAVTRDCLENGKEIQRRRRALYIRRDLPARHAECDRFSSDAGKISLRQTGRPPDRRPVQSGAGRGIRRQRGAAGADPQRCGAVGERQPRSGCAGERTLRLQFPRDPPIPEFLRRTVCSDGDLLCQQSGIRRLHPCDAGRTPPRRTARSRQFSVHGCYCSGITALFNSMAKIDWSGSRIGSMRRFHAPVARPHGRGPRQVRFSSKCRSPPKASRRSC